MHVNAHTGLDLELAPSRLGPEVVLPGQVPAASAGPVAEKRLMLAVLEDAVGTLQRYVHARSRREQRLLHETLEWFASDDLDWPFAFVNVCDGLGFDVDYLRTGLRRWRDHAQGTTVARLPFRRMSGRRHTVSGRPLGVSREVGALSRARCRASSTGTGGCSASGRAARRRSPSP